LTSLLALVGVMFVMTARVDKVAASSISENRELNFAIESLIAKISQQLTLDVPRMPKSKEEYYDYPDEWNTWLASLEPYEETGNYYWKQISDVTGFIKRENWKTQDIKVDIIEGHEKIELENDVDLEEQLADADGDGVADSKWIVLDDITSGKGSPVYAAIRVVDNGGMLNVNTAFKFDANETDSDLIDGSSQMQINLAALSLRGENGSLEGAADDLHDVRCNGDGSSVSISEYWNDVVRRYYVPDGEYTPFDISDELELRNRFLLEFEHIDARIENSDELWTRAFTGNQYLHVPVGQVSTIDEDDWFEKAYYDVSGPNATDKYSYRHIATTYNMDRIIDPVGWRLTNINRETNVQDLYNVLVASIDPNVVDSSSDRKRLKRRFAQLAVNIVDYVDEDIDVEVFDNLPDPEDHDVDEYYGFEAQPFISEIAMVIDTFPEIGPSYFAVELYNPFNQNINLEDFVLELYDSGIDIEFSNDDVIDAESCFVISNNPDKFYIYDLTDDKIKEDTDFKFFGGWIPPDEGRPPEDQRRDPDESKPPAPTGWERDVTLRLKRKLEDGTEIYVDKQFLDRHMAPASKQRSYGRDSRDWHIVYQTLEEDEGRGRRSRGSLGQKNTIDPSVFRGQHDFSFFLPKPIDANSPPLRPYNKFRTVGDITRILTIGNSADPDEKTIGEKLEQTRRADEYDVRLDLENPYHRNIFQYLTVFDPTADGINNDGDKNTDEINFMETPEYQIAGRININTAPWYVIKQLPWVTGKIARAIVAYRDKLRNPVNYEDGRYDAIKDELDSPFDWDDIREDEGFASIGELNFVIAGNDEYSIAKHALDGDELTGFPDLTTDGGSRGDGIRDDFEERDIIFSRISNLVTVRSDVFTAYILVRIGANGPQKRVIAILDRSNVYAGNGKVRIVAQHFVPDPR